MESKLRIMTVIAVVAVAAAVIEGVWIAKLVSHPASPIASPVQLATAAKGDQSAGGPVSVAALASGGGPAALSTESAVGASAGSAVASRAAASSAATAATAEPVAESSAAASSAAPEPVLSPEEKEAQEVAKRKAKIDEAMVAMAEQGTKQMVDALKLNEAQKQMAAPALEKLRNAMLEMVMGPKQMAEDLEQKTRQNRQAARLQGQTEEQISEQEKADQAKLMEQVQESLGRGFEGLAVALEEMRPVLDAQQLTTLDLLNKQLKAQQAMTKKMMSGMAEAAKGNTESPSPDAMPGMGN